MSVNVYALILLCYDKFHVTLAYPCILYCPAMFSLLRWSPSGGSRWKGGSRWIRETQRCGLDFLAWMS